MKKLRKPKKGIIHVLLSFFLLMNSILIPSGNVFAEENISTNIALNKKVTSSSVEKAMPQNIADKVVDGNKTSRWSSEAMKENGTKDTDLQTSQWLIIDLQAPQTQVKNIKIYFFKKVWATKYQIQTADTNDKNTKWKTLKSFERASGSQPNDLIDSVHDVKELKRYVRFYFEKVNVSAAGTGVSVKEIEIFGTQLTHGNMALGKKVSVSSVEDALPQNTGDKVVDGQMDTRWSCNAMKNNGAKDEDPQKAQWLTIDLVQAPKTVENIKVHFFKKVWASKYKIETADTNTSHTTWETVKDFNRNGGSLSDNHTDEVTNIPNGLKRYVRFYFEKVNVKAAGTGVSINEIEINGTQPFLSNSQNYSALTILNGISSLPNIELKDTRVKLPKVPQGYEISIIGSDKKQIISNNGKITPYHIGNHTVSLIVEVKNTKDKSDCARKNLSVQVPSKISLYPQTFPQIDSPNQKPKVLPTLQEWYGYKGTFTYNQNSRIVINDAANVGLQKVAENMQKDLKEITGITPKIVLGTNRTSKDIYIESISSDKYGTGKEGYFTCIDKNGISIYSTTYTGCLYGSITIEQILWQDSSHANVPYGVIRDYPDYQIRGVMFDVGRIPHRLQYLKDYSKILSWYKMNEFHLHLNDDFDYNKDGLPNLKDSWTGIHRLQNDTFPSLTNKHVYQGDKFKYFNEEYADPFYTKDDYRQLQTLSKNLGVNLLPEFDSPSHATAYIDYANKNPDKIEWLGPINTGNNRQMLALDINSSNKKEREKAKRARKFIEDLYKDYLGGNNPLFANDTVHVGADEYWDKNNPEAFRNYSVFLDNLMKKYGKTTRMWGAQKMFPGKTVISPDNIVLDVWTTYEEDPIARFKDDFRIVNVPQPYLYVTPGRSHKDMVVEEYLYKNWDPTIFNGNVRADRGEPLLLGAKTALWGDEFREGIIEADLNERMLRAVAITAEKTWGGQGKDSYIEYQEAFDRLKEGPGTNIAMNIPSNTEKIVDYDLKQTENTPKGIKIKDSSGNHYDALLKNGTIVTENGKPMIKFDGNTIMTTPLKTICYPYTVSFDVKLSPNNTKESLLFSGYDGQLLAKDSNGTLSLNRSFYHQSFGYKIPTEKPAHITIVGTFQNTKLYVDGKLTKMLYSTDTNKPDEYFSTFVFPMEVLGKNLHGYLGNIKAYNKAFQPELIRTNPQNITKVNVALNCNAYAERFGVLPALNTGALKRHPAWKATDGDKLDPESNIPSTDPNSYWLSSNNDKDYLMTDLGTNRNIKEIVVTWDGNRFAKDFVVETSQDGKNWENISKQINNNQSISTITLNTPVQARYVKIQGIKRKSDYYAIRELEVYEYVNKTPLNQLLKQAESITEKENASKSKRPSAKELLNQIEATKKALENPRLMQKEVTLLHNELQKKLSSYQEDITTCLSKLNDSIAEAKTKTPENWTKESYTDLQKSIKDSSKITILSSDEEITSASHAIIDSITALKKVNKPEQPTSKNNKPDIQKITTNKPNTNQQNNNKLNTYKTVTKNPTVKNSQTTTKSIKTGDELNTLYLFFAMAACSLIIAGYLKRQMQ